jgi:hypothetical protein
MFILCLRQIQSKLSVDLLPICSGLAPKGQLSVGIAHSRTAVPRRAIVVLQPLVGFVVNFMRVGCESVPVKK